MTAALDDRLSALAEAVELADGRLDGERVEAARAIVGRAGRRLGLGIEATVAALAGPTGAGKSSLFNALAGAELSAVARRRPTTSVAAAAIWGDVGEPLLDWLEVRRRHRLSDTALDGLVLLDLPDFDSIETSHRLEVDRIVELADLLVWVVDPQKYADASWHDRYLRPLAPYARSMAVVLNQSDLLGAEELASCVDDLRRLLEREGLPGVPVLTVSALTGEGLESLRGLLADRVAARQAALERLSADVDVAAARLSEQVGDETAHGVRREDRERLHAALADAAGVPTVVRAVGRAHRRRGALATGWPFVRWVRRLRPDPLRRLRLSDTPSPAVHTSLPPPSPVERARVTGALRTLAKGATQGLPDPWPARVRTVALAGEEKLAARLDRAVAGADLHVGAPRWWRLAGWLQRLLGLAVTVGALWLLALAVLGWLRIDDDVVPLPEVEGIPLPTLLLLGGIAAGFVLAFLARIVNRLGAAQRARAAERSLRTRVAEVAEELAIAPVEAELEAYERLRAALAVAAGGRRRRGPRAILAGATRGGAVR